MHFNGVEASGGVMLLFVIVIWVLTFIVHLAFATGVWIDAEKLQFQHRLSIVGPRIWFLATLLGGVFVAAAYWFIHHSRLSPAVPISQYDQQLGSE